MRKIIPSFLFLTVWMLAPAVSLCQAEDSVNFTTEIRPLLSQKCFHCHGPDDAERQGGLRLDTKAGAFAETDSGVPAIVPGDLAASELYQRITAEDEILRMPPSYSDHTLSEKEFDLIGRWIEQGAEYEGHWAYQKPVRHDPPVVSQKDWPQNEIDHFILKRLEQAGFEPQRREQKEILLRRLTLDLTGLPPTPREVDAFLADDSSDAYENVVDDLLSRPTYGEKWARMWLDLARYADSAGYADDPPRTIWAYRDYVIKSLNENKPFDQFTIEQLAGDLLPNPTDEQLIATAFHRNTMTNNEGGTDDEEFRNAAVIDRVNTTFSTWMGTTMACAQCHTHKYDPISQREYFQTFAIFNNSEDADKRNESPLLEYYTPEQKQRKKEWSQEIQQLQAKLTTPTPSLLDEMAAWENKLAVPLESSAVNISRFESDQPAKADLLEGGIVSVSRETISASDELTLKPQNTQSDQKFHALRLRTLPQDSLPGKGAGHANGNFVLTNIRAKIVPQGERGLSGRYVRIELPGNQKILSLAEVEVIGDGQNLARSGEAKQSSTDYDGAASRAIDGNNDGHYFEAESTTHTRNSNDPWWEVDLGGSKLIDQIRIWNRTDGNNGQRLKNFHLQLLDENRNVVWQREEASPPSPQREYSLSAVRPVKFRAAFADYQQPNFSPAGVIDEDKKHETGWAVGGDLQTSHELTLIAQQPFALAADEQLVVTLDQKSKYENHTLARFQLELIPDERATEISQLPARITTILRKEKNQRTPEERKQLTDHYLAEISPSLQEERQRLAELNQKISGMKPKTTVPIMQRLPEEKQRTTHIQIRGNFMSLGDKVEADLPEFVPVSLQEETPTRLDLARWLVHPDNPLTARVIANRYWEKLFGVGLVSTSEEFGSQGELPSHPHLLDWLATELVRLDWDLKAFVKTIVMSATYRQSSQVTAERLEKDPQNRLLTRGPRFRLTAEMIRDQALFVSGLLSDKMYGPPVKPPQPDIGLKAAFGSGIDWKTSTGEDRYRRGIYTTWRRSNPYPSMAAFDAPNREVCQVRRDRTNTPLQAFVTLNDPVYIEAAQALGRRMADHSGSLNSKLTYGFELCLARKPNDQEVTRLAQLFEATKQEYQQQQTEATKLATQPLGPLPDQAKPAEYAAWTLIGNVLLNLDETLMKP